jgi:soluble calcium-activated nucleotidase 1
MDGGYGVEHRAWAHIYDRLRTVAGFEFPAYLLYEAVCWNEIAREWYFFPRRASPTAYDEKVDNLMGTLTYFVGNEDLTSFDAREMHGSTNGGLRGVSDCRVVPGREHLVVLVKSEERAPDAKDGEGENRGFVSVIDVRTGKPIVEDTFIGAEKYEGVEFIDTWIYPSRVN